MSSASEMIAQDKVKTDRELRTEVKGLRKDVQEMRAAFEELVVVLSEQ